MENYFVVASFSKRMPESKRGAVSQTVVSGFWFICESTILMKAVEWAQISGHTTSTGVNLFVYDRGNIRGHSPGICPEIDPLIGTRNVRREWNNLDTVFFGFQSCDLDIEKETDNLVRLTNLRLHFFVSCFVPYLLSSVPTQGKLRCHPPRYSVAFHPARQRQHPRLRQRRLRLTCTTMPHPHVGETTWIKWEITS